MYHDVLRGGLLLLTGVGSGVVGYGAGLASLVSFPVLLALGLPPLNANITNSVALTGTTLGGVLSARAELVGMRARILRFGGLGVAGGAAGALLLLQLPATVFAQAVPWLVALGAAALLLRPWLRRLHAGRLDEHSPALLVIVGLVTIYCGYFGAGAGVLVMAAFGAVMADSMARLTALRAVVVGSANTTAAVIFAFTGAVDWWSTVPLAVGAVAGAALGPRLVRRVPDTALRLVVASGGFVLAVKLFLDARG